MLNDKNSILILSHTLSVVIKSPVFVVSGIPIVITCCPPLNSGGLSFSSCTLTTITISPWESKITFNSLQSCQFIIYKVVHMDNNMNTVN